MLLPENHAIIRTHINILIFYAESGNYFLRMVNILGQLMRLRKHITFKLVTSL